MIFYVWNFRTLFISILWVWKPSIHWYDLLFLNISYLVDFCFVGNHTRPLFGMIFYLKKFVPTWFYFHEEGIFGCEVWFFIFGKFVPCWAFCFMSIKVSFGWYDFLISKNLYLVGMLCKPYSYTNHIFVSPLNRIFCNQRSRWTNAWPRYSILTDCIGRVAEE